MKTSFLKTVCDVHEKSKRPCLLLDAIETISAQETNIYKKLEGILAETNKVQKEWSDSTDTIAYDCAVYDDKYFKDYLRYAIITIIQPYFAEVIHDVMENYWYEFAQMRAVPDLAKVLKELMIREYELESTNPNRKNKVKIMNQLLEITDALLNKASEYWYEWKRRVYKISSDIPLDEVLDTFHLMGICGMDEVIKSFIPDAVTSLLFHIPFMNEFFSELKKSSDGIEKRQYSDKTLTNILNTMGTRTLFKTGKRVEDQLASIYAETISIYWETEGK